jgi:hypothetical protein
LAATLVGERILPGHCADTLVKFRIKKDDDGNYRATLCAQNDMMVETAFGELHLLEHLRHVYVFYHDSRDLDRVVACAC